MFYRCLLLVFVSIVCGCTSPASFIQDESEALAGISTQYASFEQFKASIKSNANYARLAYASMSKDGYQSRLGRAQQNADVCLKYSLVESVQQADIKRRFAALKKLLDSAAQLLCSTRGAKTEKEGGACPNDNGKTPEQKASEFFATFAAVAAMTPAQVQAAALNSVVQAGITAYQLAHDQSQYRIALAYLADRTTQKKFKYAVDRLESDLLNADDDLGKNMRTWTTCRRARLDLAVSNMKWSDGSSQLVFSNEAVDFQKDLDLVQGHYNNYMKSFIPDTRKSLDKLEAAFQKLPSAELNPSVLDDVIKDLGSVKDNIDKLNAANAKAMVSPKMRSAAAKGVDMVASVEQPE